MVELTNAFAVALVLTAVFAFRFRYWRSPGVMAAYFAFFFAAEWVAGRFFFPPGALGIEIAWVSFALTPPVVVAIVLVDRYERRHGRPTGES